MPAKIHNNEDLVKLYAEKGYQGANPNSARCLFIGLDANFDPDIADNPIFPRVMEYLRNGVGFWREYGVHHPFLLPGYGGGGRRYHKRFQEIGFTKSHAEDVSFLDIFHYPTEDPNCRFGPEDLCDKHLDDLEKIITSDRKKFVFVAISAPFRVKERDPKRFLSSLAFDKDKSGCRGTLVPGSEKIYRLSQQLPEDNGTEIYRIPHFSTPEGKGYRLTEADMDKIAEIVGIR